MVKIWHGWRIVNQSKCEILKLMDGRRIVGHVLVTTLACRSSSSITTIFWVISKSDLSLLPLEPGGIAALLAFQEGFWILDVGEIDGLWCNLWWRGFISPDKLEDMDNSARRE